MNYALNTKDLGGRGMKISSAKVRITSEDIFGIIKEYVKVEGLNIKDVKIGELIEAKGSYKKGVEIPFQASLGLGSIKNNVITIKIFDFKVAKVGILKSVKSFALKTILKDFSQYGVSSEEDNLFVDLNVISKFVPYVYYTVKAVNSYEGAIEAEVEDIIYAPEKETEAADIKKEESNESSIRPVDGYTKVRENIESKVPEKYKDVVEYAMLIPDIAALLWRLFRDKRVELKTKVLVGGLLAYIASPIDIIPDFIPLVGKIDDVAIVLFAMNKIINEVPEELILANWTGKENVIQKVKEGVAFISKMLGSQNVGKLLDYIKKLSLKAAKEEKENEKRTNIH